MQETSLHSALKDFYTRDGDRQEVPILGYLIDVVHEDLLIEIQTRNFGALKPKLAALLTEHPVRLVHPIAEEKWIIRLPDEANQAPVRRKSPRRGRFEHVFKELIRIPQMLAHPNFSLEIVLIQEEEIRQNDGRGSWRRQGWSIADRKLLRIISSLVLQSPHDLLPFLPAELPPAFSAHELAQARGIRDDLARKMIYCLRKMELVEPAGKRGRINLYKLIEQG